MAVGHEMAHRVLWCRKTLVRAPWANEMLACEAGFRFARQCGHAEYVQSVVSAYLDYPAPLSPAAVRGIRPSRMLFLLPRELPSGYGPGIVRLAAELERVVGWERLCDLARCRTWDEWLDVLPPGVRAPAGGLVGTHRPDRA